MNRKLRASVLYQMTDFLKGLIVFYASIYAVVLVSILLSTSFTGDADGSVNGLEISSIIFLTIMSALTFMEKFKLFIQNGMTRNMIYKSYILQILAASFLMAFIDTITTNILQKVFRYQYLFEMLYDNDNNIIISFIWLFALYFMLTVFVFVVILFQNKVGNKIFLICSIVLGAILLILLPVINYITEGVMLQNIIRLLSKFMGYTDGGIQYLYPFCTFAAVAAVSMLVSYQFTKRVQI